MHREDFYIEPGDEVQVMTMGGVITGRCQEVGTPGDDLWIIITGMDMSDPSIPLSKRLRHDIDNPGIPRAVHYIERPLSVSKLIPALIDTTTKFAS